MTEPTEQYNQSQTQFSVEQPLNEKPRQEAIAQPVLAQPVKPRSKIWVLIGILAIFSLLLMLLATRMSKNAPSTQKTTPISQTARPLTPFEQRLETARTLLRDANPTTQDLPFPPLDMTLRIDKPR